MLTSTLIKELSKAIISDNNIVISPISQAYYFADGSLKPKQAEGRIDYDFEKKEFLAGNIWKWNDSKANKAKVGDILGFLHASEEIGGPEGLIELVKIIAVEDYESGRDHWLERHSADQRNVFTLDNKILGTLTWHEFCQVTKQKEFIHDDPSLERTRIAGTQRKNWNENFKNLCLGVDDPIKGNAKIWNESLDMQIFNICAKAAAFLNAEFLSNKNKIYENSIIAAARTIQALLYKESRNQVISIADLQSGKTAMMLLISIVINSIIKEKVGVIYITAKSLTEIHNQSLQRIMAYGYEDECANTNSTNLLYHFNNDIYDVFLSDVMLSSNAFVSDDDENKSRLRRAIKDLKCQGVDKFLFLLDEVHVATKKNQQFDKFLNSLGITLASKEAGFSNGLFIGVTATPFESFAFPRTDGGDLTLVYNEAGEHYYGIKDIVFSDRLVHVSDKDFMEEALIENIKANCDLFGEKEYFIIRTKDSKQVAIAKNVATQLGWDFQEFCSAEKNISLIKNRLKTSNNGKKFMIIIKDALGAGVTINTTKIFGWYDNAYTNMEAAAQSIGRNCGYGVNVSYPIFSNKIKLEEYVDYIEEMKEGFTPIKNREKFSDQMILNGLPEYKIMTYEEYEEFCKNANYNSTHISKSHIDLNSNDNIAKKILTKRHPGQQATRFFTLSDVNLTVIKNEKYRKNIEELIVLYPELQNNKGLVITNLSLGRKDIAPMTVFNKQ